MESDAVLVASPHHCGVAGLQGGVDDGGDRRPQVLAGDVGGADVPELGLAHAVLAGDGHLPDAHVGAEREQHQQQAAVQGGAVEHLAAGDGGERVGEAGDERGVLQDVEQVDGAPPALDLGLERAQVLRLGELVQLRDAHPRAALPGDDPDPAAGAPGQGGVEPGERVVQPLAEAAGELGGVQGLAQLGVVDVAVVLEVARQVLVRVLPPARALDVDLAAAQRVPQARSARTARTGYAPPGRRHRQRRPAMPSARPRRPGPSPRPRRASGRCRCPRSGRAGRWRPSPAGRRCCCSGTPARPAAGRASAGSGASRSRAAGSGPARPPPARSPSAPWPARSASSPRLAPPGTPSPAPCRRDAPGRRR